MARVWGFAYFARARTSPQRRSRVLRDFLTTTAAALALCYFGTTQAAPLAGVRGNAHRTACAHTA
ncbi:hypothetical protein [Paraburkholderia sp. Tr-20389]|uniref:hypothetical protein n=1 Tax=Paraburkholderia sp. Tr-20389 TaxID=2703903 RepID=UPI00197F9F90|nr:hypothetical protein [Paraburkholderia sp. Tr-20389]